jgi:hypothetical protein
MMTFDTPNMVDQFIYAILSLGHSGWWLNIAYWTWWQ